MFIKLLTKISRSQKRFRGKYLIRKYLLKSKLINGKRAITLNNGTNFSLFTNDFVDKYIYITGEYEPDVKSFLINTLKKGDNFIDVGANIGYFSILASNLVGPEGEVYSFEASPSMVIRLKENININKLDNVNVISKAVSNKNEKLSFFVSDIHNSGMSSLREIQGAKKIEVEAIRIDDLLNDLPKIKLIKLDIEGAEQLAISGMKELIIRDRPVLLLELTNEFLKQFKSSSKDLLFEIKELNYDVFNMDNSKVIDIVNEIEQKNIFCLPK